MVVVHNLTFQKQVSHFLLSSSCEADPGALAKYVIALVKKDKSADVLRESMISQLEVFLQNGNCFNIFSLQPY